MYNALMKMAVRRTFRAAVYAVQFANRIGDQIESRRRNMRKLRASVQCLKFVHALEEGQAARRKFRATVQAVKLVNNLANGITARNKFRAAVNVIILSDQVIDRPLSRPFDLITFRDSVNLLIALKQLDRPFVELPTMMEEHKQQTRKTGMQHLNEAARKVLRGQNHSDSIELQEWQPTVIHGKLVHKSRDFTTLWQLVEGEDDDQGKAQPNME